MKAVFLPFNFGALDEKQSSLERSRVVILPVPYDSTSTYLSGSKEGPQAIISASRNMELFDEELGFSPSTQGIHTLPFLEAVASGPEEMVENVAEVAGRYLDAGKFLVMLAGDHILSVGTVRALKKRHDHLGIIQLDAHADLRDTFEGTGMSHACTGRRLAELGPLLQVGVRSMSEEESEFLTGKKVIALPPSRTGEFSASLERLPDIVYVTIDVDVFDPSIVPSVGTPEPGGLSWQDVMALMREVAARKRVVGLDVNELRPIPGFVAPDFLSARLVYRLIGYFVGQTPSR